MTLLGKLGRKLAVEAFGGQENVRAIARLMQESGGLPRLLEDFRNAGCTREVDSWISRSSHKLSIDAAAVGRALGPARLAALAAELGTTPPQLATRLAEVVPSTVHALTPKGKVTRDHEAILKNWLRSLLDA